MSSETSSPTDAGPEAEGDLVPEHLDLGPGPRPTSGTELLARARPALLAADPGAATQVGPLLDRLRAELDGVDITEVALDATGLDLDLPARTDEDTEPPTTTPPADARRTPGRVRRAVLRAHPLRVHGVDLRLDAEASDLGITWVEGEGRCGLEAEVPPPGWRLDASVRASAPLRPLVEAVRSLLDAELRSQGLHLGRFEVDLADLGPRRLRARARVSVRKGIVGGGVSASGVLSVDDQLVLRLGDLRLSSRHPVLAVALLVLRGRIREAAERPVPLAEHLPPWARVTDLRVHAAQDLTVSVRFG